MVLRQNSTYVYPEDALPTCMCPVHPYILVIDRRNLDSGFVNDVNIEGEHGHNYKVRCGHWPGCEV